MDLGCDRQGIWRKAFYYLRYRLGGVQRMQFVPAATARRGRPTRRDGRRRSALGKVAAGVDPFAEAAPSASG